MSSSMKSSYSLQKKSQDKTQRIDQNVLGQNSVLRATGSVSLFLKISFLAFLAGLEIKKIIKSPFGD